MSATASGTALERLRERMAQDFSRQLPPQLPRLEWTREQIRSWQRDRLEDLLTHAVQHSAFHRGRLAGLDPEGFQLEDLASLPVMTKDELMDQYDDVVTDTRLSRDLVEAHLAASETGPSALLDEYVCLASGGSSGKRGIFAQSIAEYNAFGASVTRRSIAAMLAAGGPPPGGLVLCIVGAAAPVHSTGFGAATVNSPILSATSAPATLPIGELVDRLNQIRPATLQGYPAKLAELAREQIAGRLRIAPASVTCTSEMLTEADAQAIVDGFGVPPVNQFASTEGLVGHSEPGGTVLTFASDLCIAELVDEQRNPVPPGTPSASVLVTNLHNLTQPMIRYELTDSFVEAEPDPSHGHLRAEVRGRSDEAFLYPEAQIHPIAFRSVLVKTPAVQEYGVVQTPRGADVTVVAQGAVDSSQLERALCESLAAAGLSDPQIRVSLTDRIPRNPLTGKARRFIPL